MNEKTKLFKPNEVKVILGGEEYRLIYDLNAFCELEKIYDSIDEVLQMILGGADDPDTQKVTYNGAPINAEEIAIGEVALPVYIAKVNKRKVAKHSDTLNLLWAGLLHDHTIFDKEDNVTGYTITKAKIGSMVTFRNLREVNSQIVMAILQDLLPPKEAEEEKNAEAPEQMKPQLVVKAE